MSIYLIKYKSDLSFELSEELTYSMPSIPETLEMKGVSFSKNDLILFYAPVKTTKGNTEDTIFAYFQVGKIQDCKIHASKTLSFDGDRPGTANLSYSRKRVLTRYGSDENYWALPEFMRCERIEHNGREASWFCERDGIRFFENKTDILKISPHVSKAAAEYFENALLEWASSMCEDIRSGATREFCNLKKGHVGEGKTGFVKYIYRYDARGKIYCRFAHTVGKRNKNQCTRCPLYKKTAGKTLCEWSLPTYNGKPYIPTTTNDAFAYFDALLEKGLIMDYRD